jgi:hypothetical protein
MESKTPLSDEMAAYTARRINGIAYWGNTSFDVAAATQLDSFFWQGASPAEVGAPLPEHFRYVLNLFPSESYGLREGTQIRAVRLMDGSTVPDRAVLDDLVNWVVRSISKGPTLVHCQVGLNRSALIAGLVLVREYGMTPDDAIAMLRRIRSPAVLCNPAFEQWLRKQ